MCDSAHSCVGMGSGSDIRVGISDSVGGNMWPKLHSSEHSQRTKPKQTNVSSFDKLAAKLDQLNQLLFFLMTFFTLIYRLECSCFVFIWPLSLPGYHVVIASKVRLMLCSWWNSEDPVFKNPDFQRKSAFMRSDQKQTWNPAVTCL